MIIPKAIEFSDNKNFNLNTDNENKKVYAKTHEMSNMHICLMAQSSDTHTPTLACR